jgi:hypothetical protein
MNFELSSGEFRKSPLSRVASGGFRAGTIEVNFAALGIKELSIDHMTGLILAMHNAKIPKEDINARIAFSKEWIAKNCK